MISPQILVIEDDKHVSKLVTYNLDKAGLSCTVTKTGEEGLEILDRRRVDLVLLDIMLPRMDGFEVCKRIRHIDKFKYLPIIMLTAKTGETDRVLGFELGANDYIIKPFSIRELILRIKEKLKKQESEKNSDKLKAGDITVDISRYKIMVGKKDVILTNMEFKLLAMLIRGQGKIFSRKALLEHVWNIEADITTRTVDTHIKNLRKKLGKSGKLIETVRRVGYRFREDER
ncbi:MAG: response regulator transcription factor [Candidatus Omnitrophota bacterium]|nr:response regulator transcription factor [Candidatus Omnitrophota bacterium]